MELLGLLPNVHLLMMQVEERLVPVDELLDADEVFCTGTAVVESPVGSFTYKGKSSSKKRETALLTCISGSHGGEKAKHGKVSIISYFKGRFVVAVINSRSIALIDYKA